MKTPFKFNELIVTLDRYGVESLLDVDYDRRFGELSWAKMWRLYPEDINTVQFVISLGSPLRIKCNVTSKVLHGETRRLIAETVSCMNKLYLTSQLIVIKVKLR